MTAALKIIPGLTLTAAPNLPRITQSSEERRIAGLPGLRHFFEPSRLSGSPLSGKDRATPGHPVATPTAGITAGASASYGGRTVVTKTAGQFAFAYDMMTAPESFTILTACDAAAAGGTLWSFFNGSGSGSVAKYALSWRSDLGRLQFAENYASNTSPLLLPVPDMPALNAPFILGVSYDRTTRESRMFVNDPTAKASITHTGTQPPIDGATQIAIGGLYQFGSAGWNGRIGRALILDRAYHDPAYLPLLAREMAAMRAYYGI